MQNDHLGNVIFKNIDARAPVRLTKSTSLGLCPFFSPQILQMILMQFLTVTHLGNKLKIINLFQGQAGVFVLEEGRKNFQSLSPLWREMCSYYGKKSTLSLGTSFGNPSQ